MEGRHIALVACDTGLVATTELPEGYVIKKAECFGPDALLLTVVCTLHETTTSTAATSSAATAEEQHHSIICYLVSDAPSGPVTSRGPTQRPTQGPPAPRGADWVNRLTHIELLHTRVSPVSPMVAPLSGFGVYHFATTAGMDPRWGPVDVDMGADVSNYP